MADGSSSVHRSAWDWADVFEGPPSDEEEASAGAVAPDDSPEPPAGSPDGFPDSPDGFPDSPDSPDAADFSDPDAGVPASARRDRALEARRSDFAQPVPLKWIVGGTKARATGPPHSGHWCGPASLIPRNTSKRWPQDPQT
jgi:hypothetical protein